MKLLRIPAVLLVLVCFTHVLAQTLTCSDLVESALTSVQEACASTSRNQACYGNVSIQATPREGVDDFSFEDQGDIADVVDIQTLRLRQLNVEENVWGVALMQIQADLPETLPGQNVTFLLFGDVEIENAVDGDSALMPMQAFYFRTGILNPMGCVEAPADGMLIQTPEGAAEINLRANDVDIRLGSTAFVQAIPGGDMTISVIEGQGEITALGETVIVPAGASVAVPLNEDMSASGAPGEVVPYDADALSTLPISILPREIELAPPADEAALAEAQASGQDAQLTGGLEDLAVYAEMGDEEFCATATASVVNMGVGGAYADYIRIAMLALSSEQRAQAEDYLARLAECP